MDGQYVLQAIDISKAFSGVPALDGVSLHIEKGKVHALVGENGAGKSTLMKILTGIYIPDKGKVVVNGTEKKFSNVREALRSGISMIHQELMLCQELTVAENIFLGREPVRKIGGWLNRHSVNTMAAVILKRLGSDIPGNLPVRTLSLAAKQIVEIARAISNNAEIIIMDEPASALSLRETNVLLELIADLRSKGIAIIYISHNIDEVLKIADTITVLRDGKLIDSCSASAIDRNQLISKMVGRDLTSVFEKKQRVSGEIVLAVKNLSGKKFRNISFDVKEGEIIGIAGLMGSGRTEIVKAVYGLEKLTAGTIYLRGKIAIIQSPREAIKKGLGFVTEDRKQDGLLMNMSVKKNITISALKKMSRGQWLNINKENKVAQGEIKKFDIRISSLNGIVNNLSGGNQQKVVMAKVLLSDPDILIFDEPTRGIDIGAKAGIYKLMSELASQGKAIIMVSSELPEIIGMSDRVLVIHEGELKAELQGSEASQDLIMQKIMS